MSVTYAIDPTRWASIVANCGDCGGDLADPPGGTFTITGGATVGRGPLGEATIVWQNGAGQQIFYSCLSGWGFVDGASCFFWNSCDGSGDPSGYGGNCCGATGTLVNGFSNGCCPDSAWNDCFNFNEDKPIGATATITVNKNSSGPCP